MVKCPMCEEIVGKHERDLALHVFWEHLAVDHNQMHPEMKFFRLCWCGALLADSLSLQVHCAATQSGNITTHYTACCLGVD